MKQITSTEIRKDFAKISKGLRKNKEFVVTMRGKKIAILAPIQETNPKHNSMKAKKIKT